MPGRLRPCYSLPSWQAAIPCLTTGDYVPSVYLRTSALRSMSTTSTSNGINNGVAIDLSRKRKKKRILIVRKSNSSEGKTFAEASASQASLRSTASGASPYASPSKSVKRKDIVLARNVTAESLRSLGQTSPVQIRKEEGPRIDPKTKRILERSILGTVEEYEEMMGNTRGNRRRSFQPRNTDTTGQKKDREGGATVKKNERKKSLGGGNLQSITDSSFADKEAEDDLFMYRQRLTDPEEISKRKKRIEDARNEEQQYMQEEEQEMLMCDLIVSRRETNALKKWRKIKRTWQSFRKSMAKQLGKHPDDLVVSRAMEYREKREEYDMLEGATPAELKHGSEYWMMSLRGMGTRYVPVGNIFSGLFCPVNEEKEYTIDVVRQPGIKDPNRKDPPKDWRHSNTLMDRHRRLKKKLHEMRPHFVGVSETESLVVRAEDLFEWAENSSNEYFQQIQNEEENAAIIESDLVQTEKKTEEKKAPEVEEGKAVEEMTPKVGPNMVMYVKTDPSNDSDSDARRLLLTSNIREQSDGSVVAKNIGTTAIFFEWVKLEATPALDPSLTGGSHSQGRVYCRHRTGVLLPGHIKEFSFSFRSNVAGIFTEKWILKTTPSLCNEISQEVIIRSVVVEEDTFVKQREAIESKLADQALVHGVEDILRDVVREIKTPPPPPPTEQELKIQDFQRKNADLPTKLFYNSDLYEETSAFAKKVFMAALPPVDELLNEKVSDEEATKEKDSINDGNLDEDDEVGEMTESDMQEASKTSMSDTNLATEEEEKGQSETNTTQVNIENPEDIAAAREWTGSFTDLLNVIKDEVVPINLELAETLIDELQFFQQKFSYPPVSSSIVLDAGRKFFTEAALLVPETSDELLAEHGLDARPKFKRPRSLKPGQQEDPNRKLVKRSGAWEERKTVNEDGEELELTDAEKYRIAFENAMSAKVMTLVDAFVDNTIKLEKENLRASRQLQNMEFLKIECPWKTPKDDEEDEEDGDAAEGEEDDEKPFVQAPPLPPVLAAVNGGSVLLRADMDFALEDEGDQGYVIIDNKSNDKRLQNISLMVKRLMSEKALVITIVGHLGNPSGERLPEFSLANSVEGLSDLCEVPIEFVSTVEEAFEIVEEEKEKKRIRDEKAALKEAKRLEKIRLREERMANQGSDYDEDEDEDDEDEDEDDEEEEEDDDPQGCRVILVENIGYIPAEHANYMDSLPDNAEEEDIEERQAEIDNHCKLLSDIADIHIVDDLNGCLGQNSSVVCVEPSSKLVVPGLVLQREIETYGKFLEQDLGEGQKRLAIVGGKSLEDKFEILKALLSRVDEVMLTGNLATLMERARREWDLRNADPGTVENVGEGEKDEDESPRADEDDEDDEDEEEDEDEDEDEEGEEGEEQAQPSTTLTDNEIRLMPLARLLFGDIKRRGLGLHLPTDYILGDEAPNNEEDGYEVEYDGEAIEWIIPPAGSQNEDGTPVNGRDLLGLPPKDMFILDIGPDTQEKYSEAIRNSTSILWVDTIGEVQHSDGQAGTAAILEAASGVMENNGLVAVAGSNLVSSLRVTNGVEDDTLSLVSGASCSVLMDIMCNGIPGIQNLKRVEESSERVEEAVEETVEE